MRDRLALRWTVLLLVLVAGAALRAWFIHHDPVIDGDTLLYGDLAKNLLQHHIYGFTQVDGAPAPTLIRLPGYPLFLALCFTLFGVEHYTAVLFVQLIVDLAACGLLALLARRLFHSPRAGFAALLLGALCPFTANFVATPLTETLTLAAIVATLFALERWCRLTQVSSVPRSPNRATGWLTVLSVALAAALLLRPEQGLLAAAVLPVIAVVLWRARPAAGRARAALSLLACALGVLLPLVPWTLRNAHTFHVFEPLAPRSAVDPGELVPRGFYRWYRTWAIDFASTEDIYWNFDGAPLQLSDLPERAFLNPAQRSATAALLADYNRTVKPTPALDARFDLLARESIRAHPLRYFIALPVARVANMLLRPRTELLALPLAWWRWQEHPRASLITLALALLNAMYLLAGVIGGLRWWRHSPTPCARAVFVAATLSIALRLVLLLTLDNSEPRYTLELFPVLILAASALFAPLAAGQQP